MPLKFPSLRFATAKAALSSLPKLLKWDRAAPLDNASINTFASPMITLKVGPEEVVLFAHKAVLMRCRFFKRCLEGQVFMEGRTNIINLPEDDPQAMADLVCFLYTGNIWTGEGRKSSEEDDKASSRVSRLLKLFIVVNKYSIMDVRAAIIADFEFDSEGICDEDISYCHLNLIRAAGLRGSDMWGLLTRRVARAFGRPTSPLDMTKMLNDGLRDDAETSSDLLEQIAAARPHRETATSWLR